MAAKRPETRLIDYAQMNNLSSVVLYKSNVRKRKGKIFSVERIISRKVDKKDFLYLIKWTGWPLQSSTWEPSENLSEDLLRGYERPPRPSITSRLENATRAFVDGILRNLKSKAQRSSLIEMDLDIWRYVVHGRGVPCEHRGHYLYQKEDFNRFSILPTDWWYYLTASGEGRAVDFPVKAKPILAWTPQKYIIHDGKLVQSSRIPVEKISITFARRPCNQENVLHL